MYDLYKKAGYRQIITLKAPGSMSKKELMNWWFDRAEKIKHIPKINWYTVNFTLDCSPFGPPAFDGYEELWFSTLEDLNSAYNNIIMQNGFEEMKEEGLYDKKLMQAAWMRENIVELKGYDKIPDREGMVRLTGICKQPPDMTKKDLMDWFYQHAARVIDEKGRMIIPGIRWYTHCFSIKSPFGESNIDGCAENWWDSLEEIKKDFDGEVMKSQLDDREGAIDAVDPSYFQGIWSDENVIKLPG